MSVNQRSTPIYGCLSFPFPFYRQSSVVLLLLLVLPLVFAADPPPLSSSLFENPSPPNSTVEGEEDFPLDSISSDPTDDPYSDLYGRDVTNETTTTVPYKDILPNSIFKSRLNYNTCPPLPSRSQPPTSVHDLRPDDISIIMSFGDSIMAGLSAREFRTEILPNLTFFPGMEYRGVNFVTGGDPDAISMGRILAHFSPHLAGLSYGQMPASVCYGPLCPADSFMHRFNASIVGLNAAMSGSWANGIDMRQQLRYITRNIHTVAGPDWKERWKLAILEFSFNNVCLGCKKGFEYFQFSARLYESNIRRMLEVLRNKYTRVVVNLLGPFKLGPWHEVTKGDPLCRYARQFSMCPCMEQEGGIETMDRLATEYNLALRRITRDYQAKNYTDFAVMFDSGMGALNMGKVGPEVAASDCFHPNQTTHETVGIFLWNNMFRPFAQKRNWDLTRPEEVRCSHPSDRFPFY